MTLFRYTARTVEGEALEGAMEASSAEAAADNLVESGLTPVRIETVSTRNARGLRLHLGRKKVRRDDLILFCRQMATLTRAGVPLIRALRGLRDMMQNPALADVAKNLTEDLEGGRGLSDAMERHPTVFSLLFRSMIQVGENTGRLDEAFLRLAQYLDQEKETINRVKTVLRYPAFVLMAIFIAMVVVTLLVVPAFERLFSSFQADLPWATRLLIALSDAAVHGWPFLLAAILIGGLFLRRHLATPKGRMHWDRLQLRLPVAGDILLRITMFRFARAFAMAYRAGVPLVQALRLSAHAVGNVFVGSKVDELRQGIERGDTLTRSAAGTNLFPPLVLQMIAVGEETGAVDQMMEEVADFYEREVDYDLKYLAGAVEPLLIVAMGGMVLILALGVFLPMWDMATLARAR